jgi:hypothetical protein
MAGMVASPLALSRGQLAKQGAEVQGRGIERVEEKCEAVFRPQPALTLRIGHVYDFGLIQSKVIVI